MKIGNLFAAISPKIALDHYWNILGLISWQAPLLFKDKEHFTLSELKKVILKEAERMRENRCYHRSLLRSLDVAEEVVKELVAGDLLNRNKDIFYKSKDLPIFYSAVKKRVKHSTRRLLAWAIWYLSHHRVESFSISELIANISFKDEDYREELTQLVKNSKGMWEVGRTLYPPSEPILLTSPKDRVHAAIFTILKTGKSKGFGSKEVIATIRFLEAECAERVLKKLQLKYEAGEWAITNAAIDGVRGILFELSWPFFGIVAWGNPHFKLEGQARTLYVDFPNSQIFEFFDRVNDIARHENDLDKLYTKVKDLQPEFNEAFHQLPCLQRVKKDYKKWLSLIIKREPYGKKPFGIRVKIDWGNFISFLEEVAHRNDISLEDKYDYLFNSRIPTVRLALKKSLERTQKDVREICKEEIDLSDSKLKELTYQLRKTGESLRRKCSKMKIRPELICVFLYLPEMVSIIDSMKALINSGDIPALYRETRKLLENLAWMIFDDILFHRMYTLKGESEEDIASVRPYIFLSRKWYKVASQNKDLALRNLNDLKRGQKEPNRKGLKYLIETLESYGKSKGYGWQKNYIENELYKIFSYPLLLLLTGVAKEISSGLSNKIPSYESDMLIPLAKESIKNLIRKLKAGELSSSDKHLVTTILEHLKRESKVIVPKYPSNNFVLAFVGKMLGVDLLVPSEEKGLFVHSYFTSWHIFPFSSVLEFKILNHELEKLAKTILSMISAYEATLFQH